MTSEVARCTDKYLSGLFCRLRPGSVVILRTASREGGGGEVSCNDSLVEIGRSKEAVDVMGDWAMLVICRGWKSRRIGRL